MFIKFPKKAFFPYTFLKIPKISQHLFSKKWACFFLNQNLKSLNVFMELWVEILKLAEKHGHNTNQNLQLNT